ncbi:MAG: hypothetical protein K8J08_17070, partial [Thermoanaerobaculia bacterium]|nr:hypothetical protein [Thermoanaerobaculia bacterium]
SRTGVLRSEGATASTTLAAELPKARGQGATSGRRRSYGEPHGSPRGTWTGLGLLRPITSSL